MEKSIERKIDDIRLALNIIEDPEGYRLKILKELEQFAEAGEKLEERTLEQLLVTYLSELLDLIIAKNEGTSDDEVDQVNSLGKKEELKRLVDSIHPSLKGASVEPVHEQLTLNLDGNNEIAEAFAKIVGDAVSRANAQNLR